MLVYARDVSTMLRRFHVERILVISFILVHFNRACSHWTVFRFRILFQTLLKYLVANVKYNLCFLMRRTLLSCLFRTDLMMIV